MHIITPICYSSKERVEYFKKYIEHVNCLNNLNNINFLFFVEPGSENMVEMIPDHWNKQIFRNYYRYKPALNHFISFNYCFEVLNLDYIFLLEDDIICSPDVYDLSMYCLENKILNDSILCTLNKHQLYEPNHSVYSKKDESLLLKLCGVRYLSGWGTGISKSFWEKYMFKQWRMDITFDASMYLYLPDCNVISPLVSRTNQIGEIGLNYNPDLWKSHSFSNIEISNNSHKKQYNCIKIYE